MFGPIVGFSASQNEIVVPIKAVGLSGPAYIVIQVDVILDYEKM